ncbi:MAG: hypothetical protein V4472_18890 [Pseudomonadota bacterium]
MNSILTDNGVNNVPAHRRQDQATVRIARARKDDNPSLKRGVAVVETAA